MYLNRNCYEMLTFIAQMRGVRHYVDGTEIAQAAHYVRRWCVGYAWGLMTHPSLRILRLIWVTNSVFSAQGFTCPSVLEEYVNAHSSGAMFCN